MTARTRKIRKSARPRVGKFICLGAFFTCIAMMVALVSAGFTLARSWLEDLPNYKDADAYLLAEPTKVYDANGTQLTEFYTYNRIPVTKDQVSEYALKGTVDIEDERFYQHGGVDIQGILRAVVSQLTGGSEGASTITQQLVRNTVLKNEQWEKTLSRKVREAYIAQELEKMYSKDDILMMYLNTIYYGAGCYGIESAAETYFGKTAAELTLVEAATLVGLPQSPTSYDPTRNPDLAVERRNLVLGNMLRNEDITQQQYDEAIATPLTLNYTPHQKSGVSDYPYIIDYVKAQLLQQFSADTLNQGGLTVKLTLDPAMQAAAEAACNNVVGNSGDDLQAALVAIDPKTGYIKAMVGGGNYEYRQYNLATQAKRQPGSSFKTFVLTTAIQSGVDPNTLINSNSGIEVNGWRVNNINYENWGTISIRQATQWSSNTAYVQLIDAVGIQNVIDTAHAMGITSELDPYDSLALGTSGTTVLEMANGYATLAAGGIYRPATIIAEVTDRHGNVIYQADTTGTQAISPSVAAATTDVLEGVINNTSDPSRTGATAALSVNQPVAGKTGTTDNRTDLWFCGYTPQLATAVWVGYPDSANETIYYQGGETSTLPNPIFKQFMDAALQGVPREEFPTASAPSYRYDWAFSQGQYTVPTATSTGTGSTSGTSGTDGSGTTSTGGTDATGGDGSGDGYYDDGSGSGDGYDDGSGDYGDPGTTVTG